MGRDNQAKHRQRGRLERKQGRRAPYDRVLIVCEGAKTEPCYFGELKAHHRLQTAAVKVLPSDYGTDPLSVVKYADDLFVNGSAQKGVGKKAFERVCAVFDRDDHRTYHDALSMAKRLNGKYTNDFGHRVTFEAVVSIPCFELWFLLHFSRIGHEYELHREEVLRRLRGHFPQYEKGQQGHHQALRDMQESALRHAETLRKFNTAEGGALPYTDVGELVQWLDSMAKR